MGRPSKGPRLYLRAGRTDGRTGRALPPIYFIRDGGTQISTGCGPDGIAAAEEALADYLAEKRLRVLGALSSAAAAPEDVLIADVISLYASEKAPNAADPVSVGARLAQIMAFWGGMTLGDIRRSSCLEYIAQRQAHPIRSYKDPKTAPRVSAAGARRELEDLSAAVTYWAAEHPLTRSPIFTYPSKPEGTRDALSRSEAAALLWAALGWRKVGGRWRRTSKSTAANRRHLRRFILIGLYTGTRPGVLPKLRWAQSDNAPWIDVEKGWIFRRGHRERDHPTKRRPQIRIPRRLLAHLKRWREMDERLNVVRVAKGEPPLETVLHHGGVPIQGRIRKSYANSVADADLGKPVTPHWHRHTAATWLMEASVPLPRAAQYLGMTVKTLESHYAHHRPDHQNDISAALDRGGRSTQ